MNQRKKNKLYTESKHTYQYHTYNISFDSNNDIKLSLLSLNQEVWSALVSTFVCTPLIL